MDKHADPKWERFLELAATQMTFTGGRIMGRRLIPDKGYILEPDPEDKSTVILRQVAEEGPFNPKAKVRCVCALEGGSCAIMIVSGPQDHATCLVNDACGSSGLFCFMELAFDNGFNVRVRL